MPTATSSISITWVGCLPLPAKTELPPQGTRLEESRHQGPGRKDACQGHSKPSPPINAAAPKNPFAQAGGDREKVARLNFSTPLLLGVLTTEGLSKSYGSSKPSPA